MGTRQGTRSPEVKQLAALALAEGMSVTEAAETAGVARQTLWLWSNEDEEFQAMRQHAMDDLRSEALGKARLTLERLGPVAVHRLGKALDSQDERVIVAAAKQILDRLPDFGQHYNVETSLEAIIREIDARDTAG